MEDIQFNDDLKNAINDICKREGYKNFKLTIKSLQTNCGNFLGDLFTVDVNEENKPGIHFFVKIAPSSDLLRKSTIDINEVYKNEVFIYTRLQNIYKQLQEDFCVPESERYVFAKMYGSSDDLLKEWLILDNLNVKDYNIHTRMKPVSENYMNEAIKTLAKFHALSFAAEKYEPVLFEKYIKNRPEILYTHLDRIGPSSNQKHYYGLVLRSCVSGMKAEYRKPLMNWCQSEQYRKIPSELVIDKREVGVLCHSDFRVENIMVKYDEINNTPSVLPIDYQLSYYGPPANDLIYLIYTAADTELRRKCFSFWLEHYYKNLESFLKYFSIDVEAVYPEKIFKEDVKMSLPFGLFIALRLLPLMLIDPKQAASISIEDIITEASKGGDVTNFFANEVLIDRVGGIVEDFINMGVM